MGKNQRLFLVVGGVLGALGVILGAFGAHGLRERLTKDMLAVFEVGVRYHMYHAVAMLAVAASAGELWRSRWTARACWAWLFGIAIFSGSLYVLSATGIKWIGAITPFGGVALIVGWVFVVFAAMGTGETAAEK